MFGLFKKKNDWITIFAKSGNWKIKYGDEGPYDEYCNYTIEYSKVRNDIRILMEGYKPKAHTLFRPIMEIVSMYNIGILSKKPFPEIKKNVDEYIKEYNKHRKDEDDKL